MNLHPPRRENVHSGDYQLVLRATSRDDPSATAAAAMILRITPDRWLPVPAAQGARRRAGWAPSACAPPTSRTHRWLVNLAAYDPETALIFYFPAPSLYLQPYEQQDMFFSVTSQRRRLKGESISVPLHGRGRAHVRRPGAIRVRYTRASGEFVYSRHP